MSLMVSAVRLVAMTACTGLALGACGTSVPDASVESADQRADDGVAETSVAHTSSNVADATPEEVGVLFAGLPLGITEYFETIEDAAALRDRSAATVVATYSGYERLTDGPLLVPGYAGPSGVLRLYFRVEEVLGGRAAPDKARSPSTTTLGSRRRCSMRMRTHSRS